LIQEEAEAAASEAERKVAEMVQDAHQLRTDLLERKHLQYMTRHHNHQKKKAALVGSVAVAEPFEGCLLQSSVPEVTEEDELESSIEPEAEAEAEAEEPPADESSAEQPQQSQSQQLQLQPRKRIGSICKEELPMGGGPGSGDQAVLALEQAKVAQLQRGLRLGVREDVAALPNAEQWKEAERLCVAMTSRQRGGGSGSGSRSPVGRRQASSSLHCRSPRDRHRRARRAVYGDNVARGVAQRRARAETTGRQRSGSF